MSLLPGLTYSAPGVTLYGGGGGGGGGGDLVASTITLTGVNPISATLTSNPNDGFEVRNGGGGSNVVTATTIDAGNPNQAEMGIRTLSTISTVVTLIDRFEMTSVPGTLDANLTHYNQTSTLAQIDMPANGSLTLNGLPAASGGAANSIAILPYTSSIVVKPSNRDLVAKQNPNGVNGYLPPGGSSNLLQFSTIAGHLYQMAVPFFVTAVEPVGAPAAGSWLSLDVDTTPAVSYLDTFDLASVSTVANDFRCSRVYSFVASAAGHNLSATTNNNLSTLVEMKLVTIEDLGNTIPQPV